MKGVGRETTRAGDGWYFSIHPRPCPSCPSAALRGGAEREGDEEHVRFFGLRLRDGRPASAGALSGDDGAAPRRRGAFNLPTLNPVFDSNAATRGANMRREYDEGGLNDHCGSA